MDKNTSPALDASRRRAEAEWRRQDELLLAQDVERYETGERGAPFVLAAMSRYEIIGENARLAKPQHNEMALAIAENPDGTTIFFFNRCLGHPSGYGVRMVTLEMLPGAEKPAYRVISSRFLKR